MEERESIAKAGANFIAHNFFKLGGVVTAIKMQMRPRVRPRGNLGT